MSDKKHPEDRVSAIAPFGLRMLPSLRDRIAEAAKANGRSMNSEIVRRLEQTFQFDKTEDRINVPPPTAEGLQIAMDALAFLSGHFQDLLSVPLGEQISGYDRSDEQTVERIKAVPAQKTRQEVEQEFMANKVNSGMAAKRRS